MARFCENCGSEIKDGVRFCGKCGKPMSGSASDVTSPGKASARTGKRGFAADFKAGLLDYVRNPAKILPVVILIVIWIVFSLISTLGKNTALIRVISTITYSNGGMYGGIIGSIGGIFGKAFFAAVITSLVSSLVSKKNPFSRSSGGAGSLFGRAASSGLSSISPLFLGAGTGLVLYWLFNITSTPKNMMVAVAGAAAAVISLISGHGLLFSLISGVANKLSGGRVPTGVFISRSLAGFAAGFAAAVPVTFLRTSWIIITAGAIILGLGILFLFIGKNGVKRAAAGAAVILIAAGLLMPFTCIVRADKGTAADMKALAGRYSGSVSMVTGEVTKEGYKNYKKGRMGLDSFVNSYMGGSASSRLSRKEFDENLDNLIRNSEIEAVKSKLTVDSEDPSAGKCTISFSLLANNCKWKPKEDVFKLGGEEIKVTLEGTYSDNMIKITSGSGDISSAAGDIEVSAKKGKIQLTSKNTVITVESDGVPLYKARLTIDVKKTVKSKSSDKKKSGKITMDDIEGVYLYTGMNYETNEIADAYYRIEALSSTTFRFSSLDPAPAEKEETDWDAVYGQNGEDVERYDNEVDLSVYSFDKSTASSSTDVRITSVKVTEHYDLDGEDIPVEVFSSESKTYCDIAFSRGSDDRIHAVYENHMDLGSGSFSTLDHWEMVKVDTYPGQPESEKKAVRETAGESDEETDEEPAEGVEEETPTEDEEETASPEAKKKTGAKSLENIQPETEPSEETQPETEPSEETQPEAEPSEETQPESEPSGETEPPEETRPETIPSEEIQPENEDPGDDIDDSGYDDDRWEWEDPDDPDLPHSPEGRIADSVATAVLGGVAAVVLGGAAGTTDGSGDGGGEGDDGGEGDGGGNGDDSGGPRIPGNWSVNDEGDISFIDPSSGKNVKYVQTGFNPDTGEPVYHNADNWGQGYDINDLKDLYDRTASEKDYYRKIQDTYDKNQKEQREESQGPSWEARDWEREKREMAEEEKIQDARNKIYYKHGVYDGNAKEAKKAVIRETNQAYEDKAYYDARDEYFNAGYQTAQSVQKGADVAIDVTDKIGSYVPGTALITKGIKKAYIAGKNMASNAGELMSGQKSLGQAVTDAAIGTTADLIKDSADGFGQKLLYNTTMEGGKTVYQGLVDGKSAEEIEKETLKNMKKGLAEAVNDATIGKVVGDNPLGTLASSYTNNVVNNPNEE